jgi:hypothetical protein
MVKVLENKVIDLDLLPGTTRIEAQRQLREQMAQGKSGAEAAGAIAQQHVGTAGDAASGYTETGVKQVQVGRDQLGELLGENLTEDQKDQLMETQKSVGGMFVDGAGNVVKGLAGTLGGVVKGVGDTSLNTVSYPSMS